MYYKKDLKEVYENGLRTKNVSDNDIQFVLSLINEANIDSNMYIMENYSYTQLLDRGLLDVFNEVSEENAIKWNHTNEPLK